MLRRIFTEEQGNDHGFLCQLHRNISCNRNYSSVSNGAATRILADFQEGVARKACMVRRPVGSRKDNIDDSPFNYSIHGVSAAPRLKEPSEEEGFPCRVANQSMLKPWAKLVLVLVRFWADVGSN